MSAFTTYTKMPNPQRRPPFSNAINQVPPHPPSPTKHEKPKAPPLDPPLPRQNSKTTPPSPPKVITDKNRLLEFHRVGFLGEVGPEPVSIRSLTGSYRAVLHGCMKSRMSAEPAMRARSSPRHPSRPRRQKQRSLFLPINCSSPVLTFTSSTQKSRFIAHWHTPTLFAFMNALKMTTTST